jgi:hypothetical protein
MRVSETVPGTSSAMVARDDWKERVPIIIISREAGTYDLITEFWAKILLQLFYGLSKVIF